MGPEAVENEPTPLHLRNTERAVGAARHLLGRERQIHVFGGVAVQIVNPERAAAGGESAGRESIRAATGIFAAGAAGGFGAAGGAHALAVDAAITPGPGARFGAIHPGPHARHCGRGRHAAGQVEGIVGWQQGAGAGAFPLVSITKAFADGGAKRGRFVRLHPHHRKNARQVGELVKIDAGARRGRLFARRIVKRRHLRSAADGGEFLLPRLLGRRVEAGLGPAREALLGAQRMHGQSGIALAEPVRLAEDAPHFLQLRRTQPEPGGHRREKRGIRLHRGGRRGR